MRAPLSRTVAAVGGAASALLLTAAVVASLAQAGGHQPERAGDGDSPGEDALATCFWEGPISTERPTTRGFDGRNFNFPEESATYWLARINLPDGARLELRGRFPHARYISLNAYSEGAPIDALSDRSIRPRAGHTNPFRAGALREAKKRSWRVAVLDSEPPAAGEERAVNSLYAKPAGTAPAELAYRVYEPDPGRDLAGDTGLPKPVLVLDDGTRLRGEAVCEEINDPNREITIQTVPAAVWQGARSSPGCDPETNPAYNPIRWERFFNVDYASLAVITDCTEAGRESRLSMEADLEGGFYSNRDSSYIFAHLAQEFGPVVVLEGRLPRFPRTYLEPERMPKGQLRYWSLCSGESRVTVRTPDCLADRQVLERSGRSYTIAVSRTADRPVNARRGCGVAWLEWGERGDGAGDPGYGLLIMRNMLASRGFEQAIQRVPEPTREAEVMGPYFPSSKYETVAEFESRGC